MKTMIRQIREAPSAIERYYYCSTTVIRIIMLTEKVKEQELIENLESGLSEDEAVYTI